MISRNVRADRVKYPETEAPEHGSTNCSGCDQHDTSAAAAFIFRVLGEISGAWSLWGMPGRTPAWCGAQELRGLIRASCVGV